MGKGTMKNSRVIIGMKDYII